MAVQITLEGNRDGSRFLRYDDHDRVALLGNADGGTVTRAKLLIDIGLLGKRQVAACHVDSAAANDDCTVVQGSFIKEQRAQQLGRKVGIQHRACFNILANLGGALDDDQCARFREAELLGRLDDLVNGGGRERKVARFNADSLQASERY